MGKYDSGAILRRTREAAIAHDQKMTRDPFDEENEVRELKIDDAALHFVGNFRRRESIRLTKPLLIRLRIVASSPNTVISATRSRRISTASAVLIFERGDSTETITAEFAMIDLLPNRSSLLIIREGYRWHCKGTPDVSRRVTWLRLCRSPAHLGSVLLVIVIWQAGSCSIRQSP